MSNMTRDEAIKTLAAMGAAIAADPRQHCTAHPVFTVQECRRLYGFDTQYSESFVWLDSERDEVTDPAEIARLDALYDEDYDEPDGYTQTGYQDRWVHVTSCVTERAALDYIEANRCKHHGALQLYVDSAFRSPEWIALRAALVALAKAQERRVPMQPGRVRRPGGTIAWSEHQECWAAYAAKFGTDQSAERIVERGGFGFDEFTLLVGREPTTWAPVGAGG